MRKFTALLILIGTIIFSYFLLLLTIPSGNVYAGVILTCERCVENELGSLECVTITTQSYPYCSVSCPSGYTESSRDGDCLELQTDYQVGNCNTTSPYCYGTQKYTSGSVQSYATCQTLLPGCTNAVPPTDPGGGGGDVCAWTVGSQFECECRSKNGNEIGNDQSCGGSSAHAPSGCGYASGSGTCCCGQSSPPPPPPKYSCQANSCVVGSPDDQDGIYSGNSSCGGNCQNLRCSIIRLDNTQAASGSSSFNSGLCTNGANGTFNVLRSADNKASNPARYGVTCNIEEYKPANNPRNWRIKKIDIVDGASTVNIYNYVSSSATLAQRNVSNSIAEVTEETGASVVANSSKKATRTDLIVDLNMNNYASSVNVANNPNVTCESRMLLRNAPDTEHDRFGYTCEGLTSSGVTEAQLRTELLFVMNGGDALNHRWGNLTFDGANITDSTNKSLSITPTYTASQPRTVNSITTNYSVYSIELNVRKTPDTNLIIPAFDPALQIACTDLLGIGLDNTGHIKYYQECSTLNLSTTEAQLQDYTLRTLNSTGFRTLGALSGTKFPDPSGRVDATYKYSLTSLNGTTFKPEIEVRFKDGLPQGNRKIQVTVGDGIANEAVKMVEISQLVDTSLPVLEREVTVESATLLKVVDKATDDYSLKSHALYCAPSDTSSSSSPFISETRNGTGLGAEQIAGYFDADPNVKTCNGLMANNTGDFKVFNTTATSDTRSTYYLLDESKLKNQNEPYEITFGNGKDASALGKWYAEDSFCNLPASSPSTTVDIGSPWLQTKGGNTYVQGNNGNPLSNDRSVQAYNYTVNNVSFDAVNNICTAPLPNGQLRSYLGTKNQKSNAALTSYVNRINQCPEKDDSYVSTYALSSNEESETTGPRGNTDRFSKINQAATMYSHKLNNVTNYTGGDKNLFDYLSKLIDTSAIIGYSQNNTESTNDDVIIDGNSPLYSGSELAINYINHSVTVDPTVGGDLISQVGSSITVISAPVTVFKINGNLNIRYNTANSGKWNINKSSIILVDGDVTLEPDIIKNGGSLVIAAKGSIVIGNGGYKSAALTKDQVAAGTAYPLYDEIDAFLITDGKLITLPDKGGSSNISIASNPIKPIENIATKPEVKLNNEIVKKAEARTPCIVYYYKDVNRSIPFTQNETVPAGKNLYMSIYLENENDSNFIPAWQYTSVRINGVRANITNPLTINGNSANGYIMIPGSYIVTGNNVIEFGEHTNYTDRTDAVTGYWCEPFTVVGTGSTPTISGNVYCRDTNGNKVGVSNTSIVYTTTSRVPLNPANNATVAPQTVSTIATTDSLGNWSANYSSLKVVWDNRAEPYYYGSLAPTNANYPNGASRLNKASGCFNSNLEEISPKMSGNNMLLDEMNSCGDSNQSYYQSTYTYGGETEDRNNLTLNSLNFDLGSCSSQNQPTQCTAMTINGGNEDVAVTPGSDVTVQMTVLNPTETSNMVRINNRDNKCNSTRSNRAALDPISQFDTYSVMSRGATDPANFQDCEPPATVSVPTTKFTSISSVVNGTSTTYTFKIKAEQLLKKDLNTGLPIKGIEIAGPAEYSDSVNCKVYAHDNRIVYDGLKIYGGIIQTSSFPKGMTLGNSLGIDMDGDGANETDLTCKTSGPITNNQNQYPSSTNPIVIIGTASPCFLRDLIMVQNFVAPAEQIEYDPSIQGVFGSILGRKSTILSIRESTDD